MTILRGVVKAEYRGDYRIHLTFNDGTSKTAAFQAWLEGPIFEPLHDQRHFREFFVAGSTVCWPNGADIAPETLYAASGIRQVA
jgi:hypothetical protein